LSRNSAAGERIAYAKRALEASVMSAYAAHRSGAALSNRIVILLSEEMLKALDEWRWSNRIASRGERQLVERGLEQEKPKPPERKRGK
jgi:hypothetical protein